MADFGRLDGKCKLNPSPTDLGRDMKLVAVGSLKGIVGVLLSKRNTESLDVTIVMHSESCFDDK